MSSKGSVAGDTNAKGLAAYPPRLYRSTIKVVPGKVRERAFVMSAAEVERGMPEIWYWGWGGGRGVLALALAGGKDDSVSRLCKRCQRNLRKP